MTRRSKLHVDIVKPCRVCGINRNSSAGLAEQQFNGTTDADAIADNILTGKTAYVNGSKVTGSMPNNVATTTLLTADGENTNTYTIPKGYHSGTGVVKVNMEMKEVTPTKSIQTVTASTGKMLGIVTVNPIPAAYITTTDADAVAANILINKTAYVNGSKVTGSMPNNGSTSGSINGLTTLSVTIPAGYTTGGTVSLTSDIEEALAAI